MCSLAVLPLASMAIGTGVDIAQNAAAANQASKMANRAAKVARGLADQDYQRTQDDWRRQIAKQQVAFAKGGVTSEGTPTDVLMDLGRRGDVDARTTKFKGYEEARNQLREARYRRTQSFLDSLKSVSGIGTELGGIGKAYGLWEPTTQPTTQTH